MKGTCIGCSGKINEKQEGILQINCKMLFLCYRPGIVKRKDYILFTLKPYFVIIQLRVFQIMNGGNGMYDVIIIGGGVVGCAIAREMAKQNRKIALIERAADVCEGTSKANSGIIHAGYDATPGTLKAKLNVLGNQMMETLAKELDIPFKRNGSFVLSFEEEGRNGLQKLYDRGIQNGVQELRILSGDEVRELEPNVSKDVKEALYAPTAGIVCPFGMTYAFAENAVANGVKFYLSTEVTNIEKTDAEFRVTTTKGDFAAKYIINAAGVYADKIHNMVSDEKMEIVPRRGQYCLMDKEVGNLTKATLFQLPTKLGKGVLVTPTVHGNLLVGPNAEDLDDKEGVNTTAEGLSDILMRGERSVTSLPKNKVITSFAGLRANEGGGDFIIKEAEDVKGFIDVAGIASPGLSASPAIGVFVAELMQSIEPVSMKSEFITTRKGIPNMATATMEERKHLIEENPAYANVICRCELVTEGEILDAIRRPLGATTLDGIKRRTRAGMGRCQSGFCSPRVVEILAKELGEDLSKISKMGGKSTFITGKNKE